VSLPSVRESREGARAPMRLHHSNIMMSALRPGRRRASSLEALKAKRDRAGGYGDRLETALSRVRVSLAVLCLRRPQAAS
jgi:hypothetical protein